MTQNIKENHIHNHTEKTQVIRIIDESLHPFKDSSLSICFQTTIRWREKALFTQINIEKYIEMMLRTLRWKNEKNNYYWEGEITRKKHHQTLKTSK